MSNKEEIQSNNADLQAILDTVNNLPKVDIGVKADKVSGATAGNLAGLDANGNLTDSGKKPSDIPLIRAGTTDLTAGTSTGTPNSFYFVYET